VTVSLQKEPTEGAGSRVVVTSKQDPEPPASLLPRHPSEDQKLYQDLLVIRVNLVFRTECDSQNSTLLKLLALTKIACGFQVRMLCLTEKFRVYGCLFFWFFVFFNV